MSICTVMFIDPVDLSELAGAAAAAFAVPLERIEIWGGRQFTAPAIGPAIAQVAASSVRGVHAEFVGFDAFAAYTGGLNSLQVAVPLATRLQRRALVEPSSVEAYLWTLVATNGTYRNVTIDAAQFDDGTVAVIGTTP
jgi:hypothetical protein